MTEHPNLAAALVAALAGVAVVDKGHKANAGTYSYDYADIADVVKLTRPMLAEHGVVALTPVKEHGNGLECTVVLLHASGERMDFGPFPFPFGKDAQATGSMVTYHRRYALVSALGIAAGQDDDGALAQPRPQAPDEPDEVLCKLCDEMVPGARSDTEKMRQHRVEVHGWVRTPDGKVAPPQAPSGETPSPVVSPDALPPVTPSHDEADGAAGADTQHSEAASASAASISAPVVERLRLRLNTLPDETRAAVQGVITATWGSLELVPEAEARDVSRLLGDAEKAAKSSSQLAARAAGHANRESAA